MAAGCGKVCRGDLMTTSSLDATRRRFLAQFSSLGLAGTLLPGVLWAEMQQTGAETDQRGDAGRAPSPWPVCHSAPRTRSRC